MEFVTSANTLLLVLMTFHLIYNPLREINMKLKDKLQYVLLLIVLVAIVGAFLDLPQSVIDWLISILIGFFISILLSGIAEIIVKAFTGNYLKRIKFPIKIFGFRFSISLFLIATITVRILLFGI
jgi:hypothetical protein